MIIGSGGREHALSWKLKQSPLCGQLYIAPGNAGTAQVGQNVALDILDFQAIQNFVDSNQIDMIVVGPELPLVEGIYDHFTSHSVKVIGPSQAGALLEGSKDYAKAFMQEFDIPTARYATFKTEQMEEALTFARSMTLPVVVKASGLAAGKGVLICQQYEEAEKAITEMLSGDAFGEAGTTVVIEEYLDGIEVSVFVLTDGKNYKILPAAKDYKRIGEGDTGLNTGGMGAVSPVPFADADFIKKVEEEFVKPTLTGLQQKNIAYCGFIFLGFMVVKGQPYLLEYNVRMGDPETEVVLPRIKSDLLQLLDAAAEGRLDQATIEFEGQACTTVMLVSGGYPGKYEKGKIISGHAQTGEAIVFHAGTRESGGDILTNGGRVIAVSALGADIGQALQSSLRYAKEIDFEGKYYRTDIGKDLLKLS